MVPRIDVNFYSVYDLDAGHTYMFYPMIINVA